MKPPVVPKLADGNLSQYLRDLSRRVEMGMQRRTEDLVARQSVLLFSPDRSVWEITVDNTGTLQSTKVSGP